MINLNYTVKELAKLSGVTIRTLRFYDEIGLLKPAYIAENGYRYYQEKQLLLLQQILFFRELGFELKQIQEILGQSDFNKLEALRSHKKVLAKKIARMTELMKTVDKTINHLEGKQSMNENEIFHGFNREQQAKYEEYLVNRFGDKVKQYITESHKNVQNWTKADWEKAQKEFDVICKDLASLLKKNAEIGAPEVQTVIARHYEWLKNFWTPNRESYIGLGQSYTEPEWQKTFASYHTELAQFFASAIKIFAERELQ